MQVASKCKRESCVFTEVKESLKRAWGTTWDVNFQKENCMPIKISILNNNNKVISLYLFSEESKKKDSIYEKTMKSLLSKRWKNPV